jgi:hypothetical protein
MYARGDSRRMELGLQLRAERRPRVGQRRTNTRAVTSDKTLRTSHQTLQAILTRMRVVALGDSIDRFPGRPAVGPVGRPGPRHRGPDPTPGLAHATARGTSKRQELDQA